MKFNGVRIERTDCEIWMTCKEGELKNVMLVGDFKIWRFHVASDVV